MVVDVFQLVLKKAGYEHEEPTEQNVRKMFADYVDCGFFSNIDSEDVADITTAEICRVFLHLK